MKGWRLLLSLLLLGFMSAAQAENMLMARTKLNFEQAMEAIRQSIEDHGYTISHVQRCDGGLKGFGYKTDYYRVIFFGKPQEIRQLTRDFPQMIPFVPLKFAVIAEEDETLVAIFNPAEMAAMFRDRRLRIQMARWKNDFESILEVVREQTVVMPRDN